MATQSAWHLDHLGFGRGEVFQSKVSGKALHIVYTHSREPVGSSHLQNPAGIFNASLGWRWKERQKLQQSVRAVDLVPGEDLMNRLRMEHLKWKKGETGVLHKTGVESRNGTRALSLSLSRVCVGTIPIVFES